MRAMFDAFFSSLTRIFKGVDHYAGAFEEAGKWVESEVTVFAQLSEISREDRVKRERARLAAVASVE